MLHPELAKRVRERIRSHRLNLKSQATSPRTRDGRIIINSWGIWKVINTCIISNPHQHHHYHLESPLSTFERYTIVRRVVAVFPPSLRRPVEMLARLHQMPINAMQQIRRLGLVARPRDSRSPSEKAALASKHADAASPPTAPIPRFSLARSSSAKMD